MTPRFWAIGIFAFLGVFAPRIAVAQDYAEIVRAQKATVDPDIVDARRLVGDVHLRYQGADMFCDSAYIFPNEDFEAFGPLRVVQGDSLELLGNHLYAKRLEEEITLDGKVRFADQDIALATESLVYDMAAGIARYTSGGTITSKTNQNHLTSQAGYYNTETEFFHFQKDVVLRNPDYTVHSDTLKYNGPSETAYFLGPTLITAKDTRINCTRGWYNTKTSDCEFHERARIRNGKTILEGDSVRYNANSGDGEMFCNVSISDTAGTYIVSGDYGWLNEGSGESMVTERALLTQIIDQDSLFLKADTLLNLRDNLGVNRIHAYRNVRIYKSDLQGVCDSLVFDQEAEILRLLSRPVLWTDKNQITGDSISLVLLDGVMHRLHVRSAAFIASQADSTRYNQISGRNITGFFENNRLVRMEVLGNGQVVYLPAAENEDDPPVGLNRSNCSDIAISFEDGQIRTIALLNQVSGAFHPLSTAPPADFLLPGFLWYGDRRPTGFEDLFADPLPLDPATDPF